MSRFLQLLLSLPNTVCANFKWLPFNQAIKFPIFISYSARLSGGGRLILPNRLRFGMVHIGFHRVPICDPKDKTIVIIDGTLELKGSFHIGNGTKIRVTRNAKLTVGNNFGISASSAINCYNRMTIGDDVLFSWDCLFMDSDTHPIFSNNNEIINHSREVLIGNHVWIGCRSTILKGTMIPDGCVVGACSVVSGNGFVPSTIILGNPAKSVKHIQNWQEHMSDFV